MKKGRVIFYNKEKGFGFIEDVFDRVRYFVKGKDVSGALEAGQIVEFETKSLKRGPVAVAVRITQNN